ncbi:787_t:CDS:2 [Acaulospora morrowiae]|uniref:787_t:CDS:1 n=1 Tax=Acaulospora morrowiae TaxID=94023 RepID=A0A9N8Z3H9_9GLOM|nr:787_t:CDS:2 [Acaulospora morrowiae]
MEKPNTTDLFYYIKPREKETSQNSTGCHNLLSQGTSRSPSGTNGLKLNNHDLSSIYDRFVRPYKEKGVERDPTYLPYINMLPGKMNIVPDKMKVPDKSLKKLINKPRKYNEKYPPDKPLFDHKAIERNMLNLFKPGFIPGFDPAEFGLDEEKKIHSTSSQITSHNNNRSTINSSAQGNLLEMGGDEKSHEKKKKKKHKYDDYDGEKRKKHKHDKEHRKNSTDKKKRKKEKEKEKERVC